MHKIVSASSENTRNELKYLITSAKSALYLKLIYSMMTGPGCSFDGKTRDKKCHASKLHEAALFIFEESVQIPIL
jgi:hypothetical protein